jgi:ATP-dependent Lon protease
MADAPSLPPLPSDLADLPDEIRRDLTFVPVETFEDVLKVALPQTAGAER